MIHSFLMAGQSNMAGRGDFGVVPEIVNPNIFMLRDWGWAPMKEPINPDRPSAGIGLAASFADAYQKHYGEQVGLIPCADGGTCLDQWVVGDYLYYQVLARSKHAQRNSEIVGVLWHQGENDSHTQEDADAYEWKFTVIMDAIMRELDIANVPLILGEIGEFAGGYKNGRCRFFSSVNAALHRLARSRSNCAIASSAGLKAREDNIHFDSLSCRELGLRYFEQYLEIRSRETNE
ncbi:MAG: sialate O-acetylesterase [Thermoguttaceae bacterium]|nr:sialate O-acetylesterase [Thermoguttaceae bacterium]